MPTRQKTCRKKITSSKALDATGFISTEAMHLKSRIRCSARFINSCLENRHKDKEINVTLTNGKNNLKMAWYPKKIVCTCLSNYTYIMEIYFSKYLSLFECTWLFVYSICDTKVWLIWTNLSNFSCVILSSVSCIAMNISDFHRFTLAGINKINF